MNSIQLKEALLKGGQQPEVAEEMVRIIERGRIKWSLMDGVVTFNKVFKSIKLEEAHK